MKICKKCLNPKDESEFTLDKSKKDNLTIYCKDCQKIKREKYKGTFDHNKYYQEKNKDKKKIYYQNNKERIKQYYIDKKNENP
jgi:RNase P subunit RPR2